MPIIRSNYPDNWEEISHFIRFVRGEGKCEWEGCNAKHLEPHPITGSKVVLTTAHLDHDTSHNDYSNLKSSCQRCHFAHDRHDNLKRRRFNKFKRISKGNLKLFNND